jgi:hypothetical protein
MMNSRLWLLIIVAIVATTACAGTPIGPSVMVLPASGKTIEQFRVEDARCRQIAAGEVEATRHGTVPAQRRYDMAYMQCMYAAGNQVPGTPSLPAAPPPPGPPR